jgi:hypothetical protein
MGHQAQRLATVLAALPEATRLELVARLIPSSHAVVARRLVPEMETAFKTTASRIHAGLKAELKFHHAAIGFCWQAMVEKGALGGEADGPEPEPCVAALV